MLSQLRVYDYHDHLSYLKDLYFERSGHYPDYKMMDMAEDLGLSASHLSQVFNKKATLSKSMSLKLSQNLDFSLSEQEYFVDLVVAKHAKSKLQREQARVRIAKKLQENHPLPLESLKEGDPILDHLIRHSSLALNIPVFGDKSQCSIFLGIDQNFLEKKLKELKRRGFLKEEGGYYRASNLFLETPRDKASENLKEINAAFLDQAKQALLEQNIETRDISHMMLTISKSELPMIKNYLNELRREFNRKATKGEGEKDAVYCLGLSFFELSKTFKK